MTFQVTLRNATAPNYAPVTGAIPYKANLQLAVRANNSINFFDMSDAQRTLTKISTATLITSDGIVASGADGIIVSGLDESIYNNFTLMGCFAVQANSAAIPAVANWLGGNYNAVGEGMGLFVRETGTGTTTMTARAVFYYRKADGTEASEILDIVLGTGTARRNVPYHYYAMTQTSNTDGTATLTFYIPSFTATPVTVTVVSGDDKRFYASSRRLNFASIPNFQIGSVPISSTLDAPEHKSAVKEILFYSTALTAQQVADQYAATKKWLAADGVVNVSGWL